MSNEQPQSVKVHYEPFITVLFSCKDCGLEKEPCPVRERRDGEDVVEYFKQVVVIKVAHTHSLKSLLCEAKKVDIYLPYDVKSGTVGKEKKGG